MIGRQKLIGIDGLGASGKTELAKKIVAKLDGYIIIHTDDYYKPLDQRTAGLVPEIISPDFDWDRLEQEVFQKKHDSPPAGEAGVAIVVGVYTLQKRFQKYYDFTIWVDASRKVRIERMIKREGEDVAKEWEEKWLPREERYLKLERPDKTATFVLTSEDPIPRQLLELGR